MNNLDIYNKYRAVPKEALKTIGEGKLKGKSDINPMWRIRSLTEQFGPCGIGWYTEIAEHWAEEAGGESCAWVRVRLYIRDPETKEWSRPIEGVGGSKTYGHGKGNYLDDESFKMAETDAISVCCKKLGFAADVYWGNDRTKYSATATSDKGTATKDEGTKDEAKPAPARRKLSADNKDAFNGAIKWCIENSKNASALLEWYDISEADLKTMQAAIDKA